MNRRIALVAVALIVLVAASLLAYKFSSTPEGKGTLTPTPGAPTSTPASVVAATTPTATVASVSPADDSGEAWRLLAQGREQLRNGDEAAVATFQAVLERYPRSPAAVEARYRLGESLLAAHQEAAALEEMLRFAQQEPIHPLARPALFLAATAQRRLGQHAEAVALYRRYLAGDDLLAGYVQREIAATYAEMGQSREAIAAYEAVLAADLPVDYTQGIRQNIAQLYADLKEYDQAIVWWTRFDAGARLASEKALAAYRIGTWQQAAGRSEAALATFQRLIQAYPETSVALPALEALQRAGVDVPAEQQGLIYFSSRQNEAALAAYQRYLAGSPAGSAAPRARYHLGLLQQRLGNYNQAIVELEAVHRLYPNNDLARLAWLEVARTLGRAGRQTEAAAFYEKVAAWYPYSAEGEQALWEGSLIYYRLGRADVTVSLLARLRANFPNSRLLARATFWQGKALLAAGDTTGARQVLAVLAADRRPDYYPLRARQVLAELERRSELRTTNNLQTLTPPAADERDAFLRWLAGWAGSGPGRDLREDVHVRRGEQLWILHLPREAASEFALARTRLRDDPWTLFALVEHLRTLGLPAQAIAGAYQLLALSPTSFPDAPRYLQRLIFPADYGDLAQAAATPYDLDPLWLLALIRHESWFDRYATAQAEERGLTQVIPSTAQYIARSLNLTDFRLEDLFQPRLSIQFGAWYLGQQRQAADGNMLVALAGYNAGLSNALRWAKSQQSFDQDLFVEDIGFASTQAYVQLVYQYYHIYVSLWGTP
ncbi:MAG: tetratricopeptide repeat protein [Chloroflexi bacterium]|nr:tetratricopeptide repeat protein [Chloroflexota bacterium]